MDHPIARVRCPDQARSVDDLRGCGSRDVCGPDDEGIFDCGNCGIFFTAAAAGFAPLTPDELDQLDRLESDRQQGVGACWHAHRAVVESATSPAWAAATTITGDAATLPPEDAAVLVDSCGVAVRAGAVWHSGDRTLDGQPWHVGQVWRTLP